MEGKLTHKQRCFFIQPIKAKASLRKADWSDRRPLKQDETNTPSRKDEERGESVRGKKPGEIER